MNNTAAGASPVDCQVRPPRGRKSATGLSRTELHQLLDYARHCENEGWYWGNAAQFRKRHDKIKAWLNAQIDAAAQRQLKRRRAWHHNNDQGSGACPDSRTDVEGLQI